MAGPSSNCDKNCMPIEGSCSGSFLPACMKSNGKCIGKCVDIHATQYKHGWTWAIIWLLVIIGFIAVMGVIMKVL